MQIYNISAKGNTLYISCNIDGLNGIPEAVKKQLAEAMEAQKGTLAISSRPCSFATLPAASAADCAAAAAPAASNKTLPSASFTKSSAYAFASARAASAASVHASIEKCSTNQEQGKTGTSLS